METKQSDKKQRIIVCVIVTAGIAVVTALLMGIGYIIYALSQKSAQTTASVSCA